MEGFAPVGAIWHEWGLVDVLELWLGWAAMSHLAGFACRQVAGKGSTWCFQRKGDKKALGSALQSLCCVLESLFFLMQGWCKRFLATLALQSTAAEGKSAKCRGCFQHCTGITPGTGGLALNLSCAPISALCTDLIGEEFSLVWGDWDENRGKLVCF